MRLRKLHAQLVRRAAGLYFSAGFLVIFPKFKYLNAKHVLDTISFRQHVATWCSWNSLYPLHSRLIRRSNQVFIYLFFFIILCSTWRWVYPGCSTFGKHQKTLSFFRFTVCIPCIRGIAKSSRWFRVFLARDLLFSRYAEAFLFLLLLLFRGENLLISCPLRDLRILSVLPLAIANRRPAGLLWIPLCEGELLPLSRSSAWWWLISWSSTAGSWPVSFLREISDIAQQREITPDAGQLLYLENHTSGLNGWEAWPHWSRLIERP